MSASNTWRKPAKDPQIPAIQPIQDLIALLKQEQERTLVHLDEALRQRDALLRRNRP